MDRRTLSSRTSSLIFAAYALLVPIAPAIAEAEEPAQSTTVPSVRPTSNSASKSFYPEAVSELLEDLNRVATIAGIIAAGAWAYYNFFRGRVYSSRLELDISGSSGTTDRASCVVASLSLKNVGLSKVPIEKKGTALRVFACELPAGAPDVEWKRVVTRDAFSSHAWVESGENLEEQDLVVLPTRDYIAFRLELRVVAGGKEWNALAILPCFSAKPATDQPTETDSGNT